MEHRREKFLIDLGLYGITGAVLLFFYVPIFTLIAFSFQEGRYLTLPLDGLVAQVGTARCCRTRPRAKRWPTRP